MDLFKIEIDDKKYEYIDNITYEGENYVAYADEDYIYISKYIIQNGELKLIDIDEATTNKIKEVMKL